MMPPEWKYASGHKSAQNMKICPETWMPGGNFGRKYAAHLSHVSLCVNGDTDEPIAHKWCFRWISVNISLSSSSSSSSSRCLQSRYIFLAFFQLCQNDSVFDLNKCEKFKSERSKPWFGAAEDVKPSGSSRSPPHIYQGFCTERTERDKICKSEISVFFSNPLMFICEKVFCRSLCGDTCDCELGGGWQYFDLGITTPWLLRAKSWRLWKLKW